MKRIFQIPTNVPIYNIYYTQYHIDTLSSVTTFEGIQIFNGCTSDIFERRTILF